VVSSRSPVFCACEQSGLRLSGVREDGGSSPVDSAVVGALQRGQWSLGDLLSRLHHSPQAFAVHSSGAAVAHGDAAEQDDINNAAVEAAKDCR